MTRTGGEHQDSYRQLPETEMSADQIAAVNMRYFRLAAGLTQRELGARLGTSHANVSNLEKSAEPGHAARQFDASLILALALALGIPVTALFLPPPGDGALTRLVAVAAPELTADMPTLFDFATGVLEDPDTPSMRAYASRIREAVSVYASPGPDPVRYFEDLTSAGQRAAALDRVRTQIATARSIVADLDRLEAQLAEEDAR